MQVTHLRAQIPQGKEKNQKVSLLAMYTNLRIFNHKATVISHSATDIDYQFFQSILFIHNKSISANYG